MKNTFNILLALLLCAMIVSSGCNESVDSSPDNQNPTQTAVSTEANNAKLTPARMFDFVYGATLKDVPKDANVKVWFPIANNSTYQTVELGKIETPSELQRNREEKYGNEIGFFETKGNGEPLEFKLTYQIVREEASIDDSVPQLADEVKKTFLSANTLVPLDGKPLELIKENKLPSQAIEAGQELYNVVEEHMKYDKSNPGYGNGDVVWACDSKTGNCTDFHSLFISLARSQQIPARFEIGFPIPADSTSGTVGGYHCWAWFHAEDKGWVPVDISEADKHPDMKKYFFGKLTKDRISFSTGRDVTLVPESKAGPLNYFVYPHVEVDGKPWPKDKIELNFSFTDK